MDWKITKIQFVSDISLVLALSPISSHKYSQHHHEFNFIYGTQKALKTRYIVILKKGLKMQYKKSLCTVYVQAPWPFFG